MKTLQFIPAYRNVEEIEKVTTLIRECTSPSFIILFGRYAGMNLHSVQEGYEFLILTEESSTIRSSEIYHYLNERYPITERQEKKLTVYILPLNVVNSEIHRNYFFSTISCEGILLYDSGKHTLWRRNNFNCINSRLQAEQTSTRCLPLGYQFLHDAEQHFILKEYRVSAFNLYQSARMFLLSVVWVHFGYEPHGENSLLSTYSLARHVSRDLSELWDITDPNGKSALNHLHSFNHKARFKDNFNIPSDTLSAYVEKIQKLASAASTACKIRIDLLGRLNGKQDGGLRYLQ